MTSVWLIDPYSELPSNDWRNGRYFNFAKVLSQKGFDTTLWISNYSHKSKSYYEVAERVLDRNGVKIRLVDSPAYTSHISFQRINYEKQFAKNLASDAAHLQMPDVIILKDPAIFLYKPLATFINKNNIKLIVDIIDLWPELFELAFPAAIRPLGRLALAYLYKRRDNIFKKAAAITAVAPDYLAIGRKANPDVPATVIYWGTDFHKIQEMQQAKDDVLKELGLTKESGKIWAIYAGTLGENYDMQCILAASRILKDTCPDLQILIAGAGPMEPWIRAEVPNCPNVNFLGVLPTNKLYKLFAYCDFGFSTYAHGSTVSMPIKAYDYFAAGLPIVNSLSRSLGEIVSRRKVGLQYVAGDAASLAEAVKKLYITPSLLQEMKVNALEVGREFDEEQQYSNIIPLVNSIKNAV